MFLVTIIMEESIMGRIRTQNQHGVKKVVYDVTQGRLDINSIECKFRAANLLPNLGVKENLRLPGRDQYYNSNKSDNPLSDCMFIYEIIEGTKIAFYLRDFSLYNKKNIADNLQIQRSENWLIINDIHNTLVIEDSLCVPDKRNMDPSATWKKLESKMLQDGFSEEQILAAVRHSITHDEKTLLELMRRLAKIQKYVDYNDMYTVFSSNASTARSRINDIPFIYNSSASAFQAEILKNFPFLTEEYVSSGGDFMLTMYENMQLVKPEYVKFIRKQKEPIRISLTKCLEYSTGYLTAFNIRFGNIVKEANKYPKLYSNDIVIDMLMDLKELKPKYYREAFFMLEGLENDDVRKKFYDRIFNKLKNKSSMNSFLKECKAYLRGKKSTQERKDAIKRALNMAMEYHEDWETMIFELKLNGDL